ncbi:hypothetical protein HOY80DRAFT_1021654 [Tuber brumale]|nr:hypothetical protein HOY80DRAFT_1021654 [Tuber brumale]
MSNESVDSWLDSMFATLGGHEQFLFSDSERAIEIVDNASCNSATSHAGTHYNFLSDQKSPEEAFSPLSSSSPPENIQEINKQTSAPQVTRKRKPWGRELPIPTTNLPPRKRAKTAEEKEQRRIQRVLRNRAAAQSSRERKQKQVEAWDEERTRLAVDNTDLDARLATAEQANKELCQELEAIRQKLKPYEEHIGVANGEIATGPINKAVDTRGPTSYIGHPEPALRTEEDVFRFLDSLEIPPVTATNPSCLNWGGFPYVPEPIIDVSLWS